MVRRGSHQVVVRVKMLLLGLGMVMVMVMEWVWLLLLDLMGQLLVDLVGWVVTMGTQEDRHRIR